MFCVAKPYAPRAHSPYLDAAAFDASVATLRARFAMCDGAMEWYPGGFSADPGFYVPSAVNRRGGV